MSVGGSFNPSANPSGGPIDNQQRLQTSPNPSLPPADYSMGYARNFQPPSFFNPFSGYYGANTGMGGFQSQFGGFQQPQFGGFGGFGGFQQPQYGGFQQPQYGGFQQPQYGGFQQPQFGGLGGFQQPFGGGFGGQSNRFTRRGQGYTQPYNPPTILPRRLTDDIQFLPQPQPATRAEGDASSGGSLLSSLTSTGQPTTPSGFQRSDVYHTGAFGPNFGGGMDNFGGFNPMMGGLGGFRSQFPQYQYIDSQNGPPQTQINQLYSDMRHRGSSDTLGNFEPSELNTLTYLARANGIPINPPPNYPGYSEPLSAMASQEEHRRASQKSTDRSVDYLKQQFAAKNIDFGDSALAPHRQKVIEDIRRSSRMHNA